MLLTRLAFPNGQHPEALRLQLVRCRGRIGRWLREAHDCRKGSLHGTHRGTARFQRRGSDIFVAESKGTNLVSFGAASVAAMVSLLTRKVATLLVWTTHSSRCKRQSNSKADSGGSCAHERLSSVRKSDHGAIGVVENFRSIGGAGAQRREATCTNGTSGGGLRSRPLGFTLSRMLQLRGALLRPVRLTDSAVKRAA
jgi:hypothetical protein